MYNYDNVQENLFQFTHGGGGGGGGGVDGLCECVYGPINNLQDVPKPCIYMEGQGWERHVALNELSTCQCPLFIW